MPNTGIPLDVETKTLILTLGGDDRYIEHWLATLMEDDEEWTSFNIRGDLGPEFVVQEIRSRLIDFCSTSWVEGEYREGAEKTVVALVEEVRNFESLISRLQLTESEKLRDAFLDVSQALKVEIKAAMYRFLKQRHPDAAELVLEGFRRVEEVPDWIEEE
ncbi:hypothetical protein IID24_05045 [Patescibacteria group bacterium]|nr:hypothetical protein [Patescibacteria group bacterium]